MTARVNHAGGHTVYAGTAEELATIADEYAGGVRHQLHGCTPDLFRRVAAMLRTGQYPALDLGSVRFYRDKPSGEPFKGPYAPNPDEAWEQRQEQLNVLLRR